MTKEFEMSQNHSIAQEIDQQLIQDPSMVNQDPLPDKLQGITNLVLLVDTTLNDDFENLLIKEVPTEGQILHHNNNEVNYEDSSQFLFDNAHKFNEESEPLIITLQFKLGLLDDGSSMIDMLLKANAIKEFGKFKFKFYIFKIVAHQKKDSFVMPSELYFKDLNCIGFRFDTDLVPKIHNLSRDEKENEYHRNVNHHIPISISWLGQDIEELHLGQKVRLDGYEYCEYKFPKLVDHGFECYDQVTSHNWAALLYHHNNLRNMIFQDFQSGQIYLAVELHVEKLYLIGFEMPVRHYHWVLYLWGAKEIYLHGTAIDPDYIIEEALFQLPIVTKTIYYSSNPNWSSGVAEKTISILNELSSRFSIKLVEVPFLPEYQSACKSWSLGVDHRSTTYARTFEYKET
ncbi:hypothetical protein DFJ63DRAFT_338116 [Scheffersomyces coipomensis]|uniref:uncharacterized protein n=1 Tax=Scheffersomyces coipomensis TaxID=1788519 RepID=UPI00315DEB75